MKTRITILCENLIGQRVGLGEHGFSAFIETDRGDYLFDTGGGRSIVANSLTLDKDLRTARRIFLSHGHYDHTGGLSEVLKLRGNVDVRSNGSAQRKWERNKTIYRNSLQETLFRILGS